MKFPDQNPFTWIHDGWRYLIVRSEYGLEAWRTKGEWWERV